MKANSNGLGLVLAGATMIGASSVPAAASVEASYPIVEFRQYTLHEGKRDALIDLFEREFVESQEEQGMKVIGTFTDLDRPDRFVWIRGFRDMNSRLAGLSSFYGGSVWEAHRETANATMIDSDNVLLLRAPAADANFALPAVRPAPGEQAPSGVIVATVYYLKGAPAEALKKFETQVKPALESAGVPPLAWFVPEIAPNNFPRLPVREGEKILVWFAGFGDATDHSAHRKSIEAAEAPLAPSLTREPEVLRLKPTTRSLIRGMSSASNSDGAHDFDFLHGSWTVRHRLLKARGTSNKDWVEYSGTADTRPLLDGLCNVEEHRITGRDSGVAWRCYDRSSKRWAIYWVSERDGQLQQPVFGAFQGSEGHFEGDDTYDGRPIKVRFLWQKLSPDSAQWQQSFSFDAGKTWETNWVMEFERSK